MRDISKFFKNTIPAHKCMTLISGYQMTRSFADNESYANIASYLYHSADVRHVEWG